jgi:hypothetical protein
VVDGKESASLDSQPDLAESHPVGSDVHRDDRHLCPGWWRHDHRVNSDNDPAYWSNSGGWVGEQVLGGGLLCVGRDCRLADDQVAHPARRRFRLFDRLGAETYNWKPSESSTRLVSPT